MSMSRWTAAVVAWSVAVPVSVSSAMAQSAAPASNAQAAPPAAAHSPTAVTFADALAAAWARHPVQRGSDAARSATAAQRAAAGRLLPEPALLGLGYRSDKPLGGGRGARETEAEVSFPLWRPGQRDAGQRAADAASRQLERRLEHLRWQLAGDVREAWWEARLAGSEARVSAGQLASASALAADVERRLKAGDMARVDLNQARSSEQAARIALATAQAAEEAALRHWGTLTGLQSVPGLPAAPEPSAGTGDTSPAGLHPALAVLQTRAALAAANAAKARAGRYGSPELSLSATRDRGSAGDAYDRSARVGLRLPLGSNPGADVDAAQARAEQAEAEGDLAQEIIRLAATQAQARQDIQRRTDAIRLAEERLRLADDTLALQQRAFGLGHIDLPSRLRAQTERSEAELQLARVRMELQRAVSRLNQALGVVP